MTMHRLLHRRRVRRLRFVWASVAVVALSLAACSALFTAWTWRQTRDLSQSFKTLQERLEQVNTQRKAIVQLILEKRELLVGQRVKRDGGTGKGKNGNGNGKKVASHFEITRETIQKVGVDGVIKGWKEEVLNMTKAVRYNAVAGTFTVERPGVYFLYCQVLFNENQSPYVKLDVEVTKSQRQQKLQCMEGYGTTPAAGPHLFHIQPCQVSGLLRLDKGAELQAITGPAHGLHTAGKHYFSLFKVN